jgi:outer membrane protein
MKNRADLESTRRRVDVDRTRLRIAKLDGGPRWSVDANYRRFFSEDASDRAALSFNISYPLYDGARTKEAVKAQELTVKASLASLTQSELEARAEIESAYKEYGDNLLRLRAATKALEAAQENYRFAVESQKEGAANLVEVLTAQVTLTTAESNLVEAQYDAILSEIRLRLSLGRPMPGEQE